MILDSGAAVSVVSSAISSHINNIHHTCTNIATAADGHSLNILGEGDLGPLSNVLLSVNIRHNYVSISQLCDHDYKVTFTKHYVQIDNLPLFP